MIGDKKDFTAKTRIYVGCVNTGQPTSHWTQRKSKTFFCVSFALFAPLQFIFICLTYHSFLEVAISIRLEAEKEFM